MDLQTLTEFFKWNLIINFGFFLYAAFWIMIAPNFIYKMQGKWFNISRETFDKVVYQYLAFYKVLLAVFVVVPYLSLLAIS